MEQLTRTLDRLRAGETARVCRLLMGGTIRSRFLDIGLIPGAQVTCLQTGRGIAAYRISGAVIALRGCDAAGVLIE